MFNTGEGIEVYPEDEEFEDFLNSGVAAAQAAAP